jgi:hypothetical protein
MIRGNLLRRLQKMQKSAQAKTAEQQVQPKAPHQGRNAKENKNRFL